MADHDEGIPVEDKSDQRDWKYEAKKLASEMADMANRAALEIRALRAASERLAPKAEAYDTLRAVINMAAPRGGEAMCEDMASRFERRADELREMYLG